MTLVRFTIFPSCNFIFIEPFSSHFVFWPFPTMTSISHFWYLACISSYMWCAMTHRYVLTILWDILHCSVLEILHRMWLPLRSCWLHCLYILLPSPNNKKPCGLFSHSFWITCWSELLLFLLSFLLLFPQQYDALLQDKRPPVSVTAPATGIVGLTPTSTG